MMWNERQLTRLASEYGRVGYVPGPGEPIMPPEDIPPDNWLVCLHLLPDGVGQKAYDSALRLADLLDARSPKPESP